MAIVMMMIDLMMMLILLFLSILGISTQPLSIDYNSSMAMLTALMRFAVAWLAHPVFLIITMDAINMGLNRLAFQTLLWPVVDILQKMCLDVSMHDRKRVFVSKLNSVSRRKTTFVVHYISLLIYVFMSFFSIIINVVIFKYDIDRIIIIRNFNFCSFLLR